jgi:acyl carrier protein
MQREAVEQKVRQIVADTLGVHPSSLVDQSASDLQEWDSVAALNIILAVETEFGKQFSPEQMEQMRSVSQIVDQVLAA